MTIRYPNGDRDEGEWVTTLNVSGDRSFGVATPVSVERRSGGMRYGFRGRYMVLLEPGEESIANVEEYPRAVQRIAGHCPTCPAGARTVRLVVTVGSDGRVRWPRLEPDASGEVSKDLLTAARDAALRWVYRPATTKGRPAAFWAVAEVEVFGAGD
jgi:hypothetical protein